MKLFRICVLLSAVAFLGGLYSCSSKDPAPTPTVKFAAASASYGEDIGAINVQITLSEKVSSDVSITYAWSSPDTTALLGANFSFTTASPVIIPAGQTSVNIVIQAIDDTQVDGNNNIALTLVSATNAAVSGTAADKKFALTITDNDVLQSDRLQIDLIWFPDGKVTADVNAANLDIELHHNVVIGDDGSVSDYGDLYTAGDNTTGFETIYLTSGADSDDDDYYVFIKYEGGSGAVDFATIFNGFGISNGILSGNFTADDAPNSEGVYFLYAGPFTKSGDVFSQNSRSGSSGLDLSSLKFTKARARK